MLVLLVSFDTLYLACKIRELSKSLALIGKCTYTPTIMLYLMDSYVSALAFR